MSYHKPNNPPAPWAQTFEVKEDAQTSRKTRYAEESWIAYLLQVVLIMGLILALVFVQYLA